jgi:RNA recognition motif-containing protein
VADDENGFRLFVGNLPFRMTRDEVYDLFAQAGPVVSVHLPTDRETGRPRGFGFVEMEDPTSMEHAIQMFNGYSVSGRALVVNQARPREANTRF